MSMIAHIYFLSLSLSSPSLSPSPLLPLSLSSTCLPSQCPPLDPYSLNRLATTCIVYVDLSGTDVALSRYSNSEANLGRNECTLAPRFLPV